MICLGETWGLGQSLQIRVRETDRLHLKMTIVGLNHRISLTQPLVFPALLDHSSTKQGCLYAYLRYQQRVLIEDAVHQVQYQANKPKGLLQVESSSVAKDQLPTPTVRKDSTRQRNQRSL